MEKRNTAIPAAYIFFEKDDKYLIARRANTGYEDGNYQVPAGHIEMGELPSEAAIREAKEEVGVDITQEDLEFVHISYRPKHDNTDNRVDFFFRARKWTGEITNMEPEKCDELRWVSPEEFPENTTSHIRDAFESMIKNVPFRELGKEFLKAHGEYKLDD